MCLVALAASAAGVWRAHQAGAKLVGEIALEDAVLDQHVLLRRRALIVHIERAAPVGHGAVVDHRHFGRRDLLADQAGEGRGLLAVEVGFQPMTDGLVQQNAGPAGAEHDLHLACRSIDRAELQNRGAGGFAGEVFGSSFCLQRSPWRRVRRRPLVPRAVFGAVLGDDEDIEPGERLRVAGKGAVGGGDKDAAQLVVETGADLDDAGVVGAGGMVGALDQARASRQISASEVAPGNGVERRGLGVA